MATQASSTPAANPYATPQAAVDDAPAGAIELADRGTRLGAAMIDGICFAGLGILGAILIPALKDSPTAAMVLGAVMVIGILAVIGINLWLLSTQAATIGKRALNIRIARTDGTQPSLSRLIFIRSLPQWLVSAIPYLGSLLQLVDVLFIFGEERRCVHDRIADTIVVKAIKASA